MDQGTTGWLVVLDMTAVCEGCFPSGDGVAEWWSGDGGEGVTVVPLGAGLAARLGARCARCGVVIG